MSVKDEEKKAEIVKLIGKCVELWREMTRWEFEREWNWCRVICYIASCYKDEKWEELKKWINVRLRLDLGKCVEVDNIINLVSDVKMEKLQLVESMSRVLVVFERALRSSCWYSQDEQIVGKVEECYGMSDEVAGKCGVRFLCFLDGRVIRLVMAHSAAAIANYYNVKEWWNSVGGMEMKNKIHKYFGI